MGVFSDWITDYSFFIMKSGLQSCNKCGKTLIIGDYGKVLVGCDHYPVEPKIDMPEFFDKLFSYEKG